MAHEVPGVAAVNALAGNCAAGGYYTAWGKERGLQPRTPTTAFEVPGTRTAATLREAFVTKP